MAINQKVNTSGRNINLLIDTDYPNFDLIIDGIKYEKDPQTNKTVSNGTSSNRSRRIDKQVSDTNPIQGAIEYNLRQKNKRF